MERDLLGRAARDAAILFVAAIALGFIYNAASPLGVNFGIRMEAPRAKSSANSVYSNETVAISPQTQRSTVYRNVGP